MNKRLLVSMFSFREPLFGSRRAKLQTVFHAWLITTRTIQLCAISSELARIELVKKRQADSIWNANKSELVEMAYKELPDQNRDRLQKMTVIELRFP